MKPKIDQDIKDATETIKEVMKDNLSLIAEDIVKKVMRNYKKLIYSMRFNATKDITPIGLLRYKQELLTAMSVISAEAISQARSEVPKAKKVKLEEKLDSVKLGEFENLPAEIRRKLQAKADLIINTQLADLEKAIYFQYSSSVSGSEKLASTDAQIESEIALKAEDYIDGASIEAGAGVTGANTINEARNAFFFEDDVLEEIEAFEFVNGDPVSPICQSLTGTIFAKDDPNIFIYQQLIHFRSVLEGSLISTINGPVPIEKINFGDLVLTHTGKYKQVYETMNKFEDTHYFNLVLDNGKSLFLTGEHPVLTSNRGWLRMDELLFTDDIVCEEDVLNK